MTAELMGGDIGALAKALAAAQGEMGHALKDGKNPHYKSEFATLASVRDVVVGPLSKNGLALTQHPSADGSVVTVRTMLMHEAGGWIASEASATAKDAGPQSIGSTISYLRRYSLAALCGIAQADDDGHAASAPVQQSRGNGGGKPTQKQLEYLDKMMGSSVFTDAERDRAGQAAASGDRERVSKALEWAKEQLDARKGAS